MSLERLTTRQREVAQLAALGLSDRQIAEKLQLSPQTVRTHLRNIFARLDIGCRGALSEMLFPVAD